MPELSFETVPLILAFIVPGFVWSRVHRYIQEAPEEQQESWLGVCTLSAINYAFWFWLIPWLWVETRSAVVAASAPPVGVLVSWGCVTFVSPLAFGLLTGYAHRAGWWRSFLRDRLRVAIPHPVRTGWSYAFATRSQRGPMWVTVRLKDDSLVHGLFAEESLASSSPGERDLYLEHAYTLGERGEIVPSPDSAGVWIAGGEIKAMEFRWIEVKEIDRGVKQRKREED